MTKKHSKKKKSLLGIGTALLPPAVTMFVNGKIFEGTALTALAVACFIGYDVLDDKLKESLTQTISEEQLRNVADEVGKKVKETVEK